MTDDELLDYLMTSDLHENWSPEELKSMILFFRKEVRIIHGRKQSMLDDIDRMKKLVDFKERLVVKKEFEKTTFENKYNKLLNKKLSFKERFFGKIINKR